MQHQSTPLRATMRQDDAARLQKICNIVDKTPDKSKVNASKKRSAVHFVSKMTQLETRLQRLCALRSVHYLKTVTNARRPLAYNASTCALLPNLTKRALCRK